MYKRIDFTQLEGMPMTQETLDFLQTSYRDTFAGIAALFGDLVIITGVTDLGADYSDGWVSIAGEILPFVGGTKAANIIVEEIVTAKTFADASDKDLWHLRRAKSASSGGNAISGFVRLNTLKQVHADEWVVTARLADGSVTTVKLSDGAVSAAKLAANAVTAAKIADANVTAAKLADNAVTTAKIADANVTAAKLAPNAVTSDKVDATVARAGSAGVDADTIAAPGLYYISSNGPGGELCLAFVTSNIFDDGNIAVLAIQLGGTGKGDIYLRLYGGSWGPWQLLNDASA